jgi:peroxiredoxin
MKKRVPVTKHTKVYITITLLALAAAAYVVVFNNSVSAREPQKAFMTPGGPAGEVAPGFTLPDLGGKSVSLSSFKGKVVILDFWATWCPPCRREIPDFISLQKQYGSRGLQVVGVALDELDKVKGFVAANGMNYPVLLGNDRVVESYGGISGIPTTYILDRKGRIIQRFEGFRSKETFESEVKKLL